MLKADIMDITFSTWLASAGVAALLGVFFLNLFHKVRADSYAYILTNLAGASLACIASAMIQFVPFIILEGTWAAVSAAALLRKIRQRP